MLHGIESFLVRGNINVDATTIIAALVGKDNTQMKDVFGTLSTHLSGQATENTIHRICDYIVNGREVQNVAAKA
jgi:hypothetical protein